MPEISVIIPIYNVENYLAKCLDSVINQTYKDIEIICVNDCSLDNSVEIAKKYEQKDGRIRIIQREQNGGLSAARNSGIRHANGKYLYFLDSDDWIDRDYIERMFNMAQKSDADIILNTHINYAKADETRELQWLAYPKAPVEGEFLSSEFAINNSQCMIWAHLYKKNFFDKYNLCFPENYVNEDEYFQHISKINTNKILAFYGSAYYYFQRENSIMTKCKTSGIYNYSKIVELILEFYKQNNIENKFKVRLFKPVVFFNLNSEEDFQITKKLFEKLKSHISIQSYLYSDFEHFFINKISNSKSFNEYINLIRGNLPQAYKFSKITY